MLHGLRDFSPFLVIGFLAFSRFVITYCLMFIFYSEYEFARNEDGGSCRLYRTPCQTVADNASATTIRRTTKGEENFAFKKLWFIYY